MSKFRKFPTAWGSKGPSVTLQNDSRMTGVGRILERSKLDELPQLWNILIGEMSFVGPRPESLAFKHLFVGEYEEVLSYKPGIFGPNQIKYRNESAMYPAGVDPHSFYETGLFPAKAKNDLTYFKKANFLSDIWCIVCGVFSILFNVIVWRPSTQTSALLLVWDLGSIIAAWSITHWLKFAIFEAPLRHSVELVFIAGCFTAPMVGVIVFLIVRIYRHPIRYFSGTCLLYTSPSPRDRTRSRMPSSA